MNCKICGVRKPRRYCPGVNGDICAICCGEQREVTVRCPYECPFLQESRRRDRNPMLSADAFPNQDVRITDRFLAENEELLLLVSAALFASASATPDAVDLDVREALAALIQTERTSQSGLYYESRPQNPIAAAVREKFVSTLEKPRKQAGFPATALLGILVFLQRLELQENTGRPKSRAFLQFLMSHLPAPPEKPNDLLIQV